MPIIQVTTNQPVPYHPDFNKLALKWQFYDLSVEGGSDYVDGKDGRGKPVLWKSEFEDDPAYERRKDISPYTNYCEPIVRKYRNYIYNQPIERDQENKQFIEWSKDVDLLGSSLHQFMRTCTFRAQQYGRYFAVADTTKTNPYQTVAQAQAAGNRCYFSPVHPTAVVNWVIRDGVLLEALIRYSKTRLVLYTQQTIQEISVREKDGYVSGVGAESAHGFGILPVVMFTAMDNMRSQLQDIAPLNRALFNVYSLLNVELYANTYTTNFLLGVNADQLKDSAVAIQGKRVIAINKPDAKVDRMVADSSQAESIRQTITLYEQQIYRAAGLAEPEAVKQAQSGYAIKLRHSEVGQIVADVADRAEDGENKLIQLYSIAHNQKVKRSDYPDTFDTDDLEAELDLTIKMLTPSFPATLRAEQMKRLSNMLFPKIDKELRQQIAEEAEQLAGISDAETNTESPAN